MITPQRINDLAVATIERAVQTAYVAAIFEVAEKTKDDGLTAAEQSRLIEAVSDRIGKALVTVAFEADPATLNVGDWVTVTLRYARVEERLTYDESEQYITVGHDAIPEAIPVALTEHTSVTFLASKGEQKAQARATSGGAA